MAFDATLNVLVLVLHNFSSDGSLSGMSCHSLTRELVSLVMTVQTSLRMVIFWSSGGVDVARHEPRVW